MPNRVLIAGVSTRAAAESAARAGFDVTTVDAFGDLDQHHSVRALSLTRDLGLPVTPQATARAGRTIDCDAVVYLSNLDNHPSVVRSLAAGRALWGNPPEVLRRVRDPLLVARELNRRGLPTPGAYAGPQQARRTYAGRTILRPPAVSGHWLVKPLASGGGHGVRQWNPATRIPRNCYLQEFVGGPAGSVVFVAAGGRATPLGVSLQLVGEPAFGAKAYRYCGNILAPAGDAQFAHDEELVGSACALSHAISEEFNLVGVNGIDFIARDGVAHAIEVNPRWSASMELVERAYGVSVFGAHAAACAYGALPGFDFARARHGAGASGKAIVFARRDVVAGDTRAWLADSTVRDVPHPGERIRAGRPVCTVFANGRDSAGCHAALVRRAERIYDELDAWTRQVA
jgi:uncharacterized protein